MYGEKAWRQLHKNSASDIEQVLEATPHKTAAVWPLTPIMKTIKIRWIRYARRCWRREAKLISDILQWTPLHEREKAGRPARTYIQQLYADTGCSLEDLPEVMDDREEWWERVRETNTGSMTWWWYMFISYNGNHIYICIDI